MEYRATGFGRAIGSARSGHDGALPLDLRQAIEDPALVGQFDVLTNSGISEHVDDQYACFQNMHRLVKPGAVLIHPSPQTGSWPGHGFYYYTFDFHRQLAELCRYELIAEALMEPRRELRHWLKMIRLHLVCLGVRKTMDNEFISRTEFERIASQRPRPMVSVRPRHSQSRSLCPCPVNTIFALNRARTSASASSSSSTTGRLPGA
jgi:hypothetical protein